MKHDSFIEQAMKEGAKSDLRHRHGAVIVHRGKIIARGHNKCDLLNYKVFNLHAEVAAIMDMKKNRDQPEFATMYVIRLGSCGTKNSKPCVNCERSIIQSGIRRVYFSSTDSLDGNSGL